MIAMTTNSSMSVKAFRLMVLLLFYCFGSTSIDCRQAGPPTGGPARTIESVRGQVEVGLRESELFRFAPAGLEPPLHLAPEEVVTLLKALREDSDLADDGHEVRVARPAGHDVPVEMVFDSRPSDTA